MFRRRFHQAGLARFTYKVSSLKMMDLSSLFLPIAFGFLPIAFVLFFKIQNLGKFVTFLTKHHVFAYTMA